MSEIKVSEINMDSKNTPAFGRSQGVPCPTIQDYEMFFTAEVLRSLMGQCAGRSQLWREGFLYGLYELSRIRRKRGERKIQNPEFKEGMQYAFDLSKKGLLKRARRGTEKRGDHVSRNDS